MQKQFIVVEPPNQNVAKQSPTEFFLHPIHLIYFQVDGGEQIIRLKKLKAYLSTESSLKVSVLTCKVGPNLCTICRLKLASGGAGPRCQGNSLHISCVILN